MAPTETPSKPPLSSLISTHDFEHVASQTFTPKTWAFVSSAATDLHTKHRNRTAWSDIHLRPRTLRNVSNVDLSTTILGGSHTLRMPVFCSPVAMARMVHPDGEKAIGRACKDSGIAQCVSTSASYPVEDIVDAIRTHHPAQQQQQQRRQPFDVPVFFQLYVDRQRENSRRLVRRARDAGASAVFLTIDAPIPGKREADERVQSDDESLSSGMSGAVAGKDNKGGSIGRTMGGYIDDSVSWADIPWLRGCAGDMRIVLKGIQTHEDAVLAMEAGVDGIVVSNHGGRSLDTAPATILVLLELRRNCPQVFEALDVFVDGGITRGTDIFKALCLGAKAVGIGRGQLYGLNYGHEGVARYVEILRDELETTMKMCGVTRIGQLNPSYLNTLDVDQRIPKINEIQVGTQITKSKL